LRLWLDVELAAGPVSVGALNYFFIFFLACIKPGAAI
jgi:hypothetical protein